MSRDWPAAESGPGGSVVIGGKGGCEEAGRALTGASQGLSCQDVLVRSCYAGLH